MSAVLTSSLIKSDMTPRVLLLALLPVASAGAQTTPAGLEIGVAASPLPFTATDTARALRNLFHSRRNTGGWLTGGSAFFAVLTGVGTLADNNGRNCGGFFCPDAAGSALLIGIGTAPAWMPGLVTLIRFSRKREAEALAAYEQTRNLPRRLQRNLAPRFFNTNYRFTKKN